jgi:tetratricopeptide (TPR) repeat protein
LTSATPFDKDRFRAASYDELRRIIREEEPLRPSTRLSTLAADRAATVAEHRRTDVRHLRQAIRGELDWIVMKCLEKDRNRRYESAGGLARDVERYLHDEPVQACPPSAAYRLKKLIRRNKVTALAGSAIAAALIAGLTMASIGFMQARRQAEIARIEAVRSSQVAQFLKDMLKAAGPGVARGRDATLLREILDNTAERVEKDLRKEPEVQGDLWFTLGQTYADIGENNRAISTFQHAVESYQLALGEESTKLALAFGYLGRCQSRGGFIGAGKANAHKGLQIAREIGDPETLATCLFNMGLSLDHSMLVSSEGEPFLRESVAIRRQLGNDPMLLAESLSELAVAIRTIDSAEAEQLIREALSLHRQYLGTEHPEIAHDMYVLGQVLIDRHQFSDSEAVLREAVALARKILDQNDPKQYITLCMLLNALRLQGKWDEVESLARQPVGTYPSNVGYLGVLGSICAYRGNWQAATEQFSRAIELDPNYTVVVGRQAIALLKLERYEEYQRLRHDYLFREFDSEAFGSEHMLFEVSAFLLLPAEGADLKQLCRMGELAGTPGALPRNEYSKDVIKSQTEYRRGNFKAASELANLVVCRNDDSWSQRKAQAWFLRAMACAQLHEFESARTAFAEGSKLINQPDRDSSESWPWRWPGWIIAELLRDQAAELLGITESRPSHESAAANEQSPQNDNSTSLPTTNPEPKIQNDKP